MLKELLEDRGIYIYGVSTPEQYNIEPHFQNRKTFSNFEHDLESRKIISDYFPECMSILSIGVPYPVHCSTLQKGYGGISSMAWGHDYHKTVKALLEGIVEDLKGVIGNFEYKLHVDSGPLVDRELAVNGGLGFFGKNQFVIHPECGLNFYIGHILVNIELLHENNQVAIDCGSCTACIDACPVGALGENFAFNPALCLSEVTQKKEHLTIIETNRMGMNLYGCDVCQKVCPYLNKNIDTAMYAKDLPQIELEDILSMSNRQFKETFMNTGFFWRGLKVIKRNAIVAMGNSGDEKYIQVLKNIALDVSDYQRRYIILSIIKIKQKSPVDTLPILNDNNINGVLNNYVNFVKNI